MDSECLKDITYLIGDEDVLRGLSSVPVRVVFDDLVIDFFNELSRHLLSERQYREYMDLISYGFWVRKANLTAEKERHGELNRMGKGVAFHIAPSNVPINFMVSMTSGLLAGNACVVRVSDKPFDQVDILVREITRILDEERFSELRKSICVIRYPHSKEITDWISSRCDIRIVWGGNRTIEEIRKSPLPPRSQEMTFSDRYSLAVINMEEYKSYDEKKRDDTARLFYTDTYYSDQNACSSPRMVVWIGEKDDPEVRELFWECLKERVKKEYTLEPVISVDKLETFSELITDEEVVKKSGSIKLADNDPLCIRISVEKLSAELMDYKMLGGYFFEYITDSIDSIEPVLKKPAQTIAYLGIGPEELERIVKECGPRGVDRIVPIGHTMDLSFIWDGYDMVETMSRVIQIAKPNKGGLES